MVNGWFTGETLIVGLFIVAGLGFAIVVIMFITDLLLALAQYLGIVRNSQNVSVRDPPYLLEEENR